MSDKILFTHSSLAHSLLNMLSLETFHELLTPPGQAAIAAAAALLPTDATLLPDLATLRKTFSPELASAALDTVLLRQRAHAKFSRADAMYFTREALEQASGELVARHRATRYADSVSVYDVCCSIGSDALELALAGCTVQGIDRDALRVAMAQANAAVYGVAEHASFRVADALQFVPPPDALLFFDPARRSGQTGNRQRVFRPEAYEPPLSLIEGWIGRVAGFGVKVAPGIPYDALPYECEVEVVSLAGEVKEACLWFGALQQHTRSATLLPSGATLHATPVDPTPIVAPQGYLYEPDGAVIRAHLIEQLAQQLDAAKIDEQIAFLTRSSYVPTPFARAFRIHEVLPFNLKRLRTRLRELHVGHVVVKKRGSPIDPQVLEHQLRLDPSLPQTLTIILTQVRGQPSVVLCEPVTAKL